MPSAVSLSPRKSQINTTLPFSTISSRSSSNPSTATLYPSENMEDSTADSKTRQLEEDIADDNGNGQQTAEPSDLKHSSTKDLSNVLEELKIKINDPKCTTAANLLMKDCEDPRIIKNLIDLLHPVMNYIDGQNKKLHNYKDPLGIYTVKVHIVVDGETFGAARTMMNEIQSDKQLIVVEATEQECDVILVFCPVSSRPGSDVEITLSKIQGKRPIILVVMHHTRKPDYPTKGIKVSDIQLQVHALFHETQHGLLQCEVNTDTISQIQQKLKENGTKKRKENSVQYLARSFYSALKNASPWPHVHQS